MANSHHDALKYDVFLLHAFVSYVVIAFFSFLFLSLFLRNVVFFTVSWINPENWEMKSMLKFCATYLYLFRIYIFRRTSLHTFFSLFGCTSHYCNIHHLHLWWKGINIYQRRLFFVSSMILWIQDGHWWFLAYFPFCRNQWWSHLSLSI